MRYLLANANIQKFSISYLISHSIWQRSEVGVISPNPPPPETLGKFLLVSLYPSRNNSFPILFVLFCSHASNEAYTSGNHLERGGFARRFAKLDTLISLQVVSLWSGNYKIWLKILLISLIYLIANFTYPHNSIFFHGLLIYIVRYHLQCQFLLRILHRISNYN